MAVYIYAEGGTAKEIKKECDELFDFQELWDEAAQRYTMQPADSWLRPLPEEALTELDREAAEWGFNYRYSQRDGTDD